VGAAVLTNGDSGVEILDPFMRRILEVLYDGKPEAAASITAAAANLKAEIAKERLRLVIAADPALSARLAKHYVNADLGHIDVCTTDRRCISISARGEARSCRA
jgi:hypothetical protein